MPAEPTSAVTVFGVATVYAWEAVETLGRLGHHCSCVDNVGGADPRLPGMDRDPGSGAVMLGPSTPLQRSLTLQAAWRQGAREFPAIVDPTAAVAESVELGHAVFVNALVAVGANSAIGCGTNLNRSSSIGHDCVLKDFVATGPGAVLCGAVAVGTGAFLGAGCVVLPGRRIGENATVGAGAIVTKDVPDSAIVVGNPAHAVGANDPWEGPACPMH